MSVTIKTLFIAAYNEILLHLSLLAGLGLCLAISAWIFGKWSNVLVSMSSALYLVYWFPFRPIVEHGVVRTVEMLWRVQANSGFGAMYFVREIVLPICFVSCVILVLFEVLRLRSGSRVN